MEDLQQNEEFFFIDTSMENFRIMDSSYEENKIAPMVQEIQQQGQDDGLWLLYFDGACSKEGSGVGLILISPKGKSYKYLFSLKFECINNVAKYEALLLGLNMALKHNIKKLRVIGDSKLVVYTPKISRDN